MRLQTASAIRVSLERLLTDVWRSGCIRPTHYRAFTQVGLKHLDRYTPLPPVHKPKRCHDGLDGESSK